MSAVVHAKTVKGKKIWYVWGAHGAVKWERAYPSCRTRSALYEVLREELGLPHAANAKDVVFALMTKTWNGARWIDDFSLRLKTLREKAGLKQAKLAEQAGLSVQAVASLEQGTRGPTWETVRRLALALDVGEEQFKEQIPMGTERRSG